MAAILWTISRPSSVFRLRITLSLPAADLLYVDDQLRRIGSPVFGSTLMMRAPSSASSVIENGAA